MQDADIAVDKGSICRNKIESGHCGWTEAPLLQQCCLPPAAVRVRRDCSSAAFHKDIPCSIL